MVTQDEYELPLVVADNIKKLMEITGKTQNKIMSSISHYEHSGVYGPFRRVEFEWEEDEI